MFLQFPIEDGKVVNSFSCKYLPEVNNSSYSNSHCKIQLDQFGQVPNRLRKCGDLVIMQLQ